MTTSESSSVRNPASSWEMLTRRWEAAYTSYRTTRAAYVLVCEDEVALIEYRRAEATALAELSETKAQMDALIAQCRASRPPIEGVLKVATVVHGRARIGSIEEWPSAQVRAS